jgi:hypothetical protein
MLKNILKLEGAQKLTKSEQKNINGGGRCPRTGCWDYTGFDCINPGLPLCEVY